MAANYNPILYLLSDYPSLDTGEDGGYDTGPRILIPDLDFGLPDQIKVLNRIELYYESLREVPLTVKVWNRYPLTDAGTTSESVSFATEASAGQEPGVFWGTTWSGSYATLKTWSSMVHFTTAQAKSFWVGISATSDLTPWKLLKVVFRFHADKADWRGSGVNN